MLARWTLETPADGRDPFATNQSICCSLVTALSARCPLEWTSWFSQKIWFLFFKHRKWGWLNGHCRPLAADSASVSSGKSSSFFPRRRLLLFHISSSAHLNELVFCDFFFLQIQCIADANKWTDKVVAEMRCPLFSWAMKKVDSKERQMFHWQLISSYKEKFRWLSNRCVVCGQWPTTGISCLALNNFLKNLFLKKKN